MIDKRPQADRILLAEIWGEARSRAQWRELTADEESAAVAALRELAGGRADLPAEVAGVLEGTSEGELDELFVRQAAMLYNQPGKRPFLVCQGCIGKHLAPAGSCSPWPAGSCSPWPRAQLLFRGGPDVVAAHHRAGRLRRWSLPK